MIVSAARYRALVENFPFGILDLDLSGMIASGNVAACELLGLDRIEAAAEHYLNDFIQAQQRPHADQLFSRAKRGDTTQFCFNAQFGPQQRILSCHFVPLVCDDDSIAEVLCILQDVTQAQKLSQELEYRASHDPLTGFLNQHELEKRIDRILVSVQKERSDHALIYMDLDQFKIINDECGHLAGDELLRQLGDFLQQHVRQRDTLARIGGDEFAILLEHCVLDQALHIAQGIQQRIDHFRFYWEHRGYKVSASFGVVPITAMTGNVRELFRQADAACYAAKGEAHGGVHLYHGDENEIAQRRSEMQWINRLEKALKSGGLELRWQKIAPLGATDVPGEHYEVLLYMIDEQGQSWSPGVFMTAAERYNMAAHIDRWTVGFLFEWLARHPRQLQATAVCSVNLSGQTIGKEGFLEFVVERFEHFAIPAAKICFEITETAAIGNLSNATKFMGELRRIGCSFALDDFGSGLSSFAYLKTLPVDYLKIDGLFIRDIVNDPIAYAMVRSIHQLGHIMGMQTIAEYVENEAILTKLEEIGVDYVQGYAIAQPLSLHRMRVE